MPPLSTIVPSRIVSLLQKHHFDNLSPSEALELENWIDVNSDNKQAFIQLSDSFSAATSSNDRPPRKTGISLGILLLTLGIVLAAILGFAWKMVLQPKPSAKTTVSLRSSKPFEAPGVKIDSQIVFKQATLRNVMNAISHHYNIPVVYRGNVPDSRYTAKINRTMPILEMVNLLNLVGIRSEYDGKQIIVRE